MADYIKTVVLPSYHQSKLDLYNIIIPNNVNSKIVFTVLLGVNILVGVMVFVVHVFLGCQMIVFESLTDLQLTRQHHCTVYLVSAGFSATLCTAH